MKELYRRALLFLLAAALAVVVTSVFVGHAFYMHVTVPCRGVLEKLPTPHQLVPSVKRLDWKDKLSIEYDRGEIQSSINWTEINPHVFWRHADDSQACNVLPVDGPAAHRFIIARDDATDTYVVQDLQAASPSEQNVAAFRTVDRLGRRYDHMGITHLGDLPLLILIVATFGLILASAHLLGVRKYALQMYAWKAGRSRIDGVVESEAGEMMGSPRRAHAPREATPHQSRQARALGCLSRYAADRTTRYGLGRSCALAASNDARVARRPRDGDPRRHHDRHRRARCSGLVRGLKQ